MNKRELSKNVFVSDKILTNGDFTGFPLIIRDDSKTFFVVGVSEIRDGLCFVTKNFGGNDDGPAVV